MKFKINNTWRTYLTFNRIAVVFVPFFIIVFLSRWLLSDYFKLLFYILFGCVFVFSLLFTTLVRQKSDVDYDGLCVRYKTSYGEKSIDLNKVKSVKYGLQKGLQFRGKRNYIYLEFQNFDQNEKPVRIYDHVPEQEMEKVMNGFHFGYPLLLMYDDIISKYPDKV